MATETSSVSEPALWRPIAIGDYVVPQSDAKQGWLSTWRRLWSHGKETADGELLDPEPVPADVVAHLVPSVDLRSAATGLAGELEAWLERDSGAPRSIVLVGPPGSAVQAVSEEWARSIEGAQLAAPRAGELDEGRWKPALPDDLKIPLVLPPLEQLFLRRAGGVDLLRDVLERLQQERRSFLAACDSWSWKYLRRTLPGNAGFDRILAPAPFDARALRSWLQSLDPTVMFVDGRHGRPLLGTDDDMHPFLRALAARSRGIPGVAAALWSLALCTARLGAPKNDVRPCRLPNWDDIDQPKLRRQDGKSEALLLHALLLHGGLEERALATVLPLAGTEIRTLLWELNGRGLVSETDGSWRVSAVGYPAARSHLALLNLPLDDF